LTLRHNSRKQIENLVRTAQGKLPALSSQEEYLFFRQRYVRGDESETAFLVLSDATIRRWSVRNGALRIRAAPVPPLSWPNCRPVRLTDWSGAKRRHEFVTDYSTPDLGELGLAPAGVTSATYGTLQLHDAHFGNSTGNRNEQRGQRL